MIRGRTLALLLVASWSAACASTGAVPKPFPVPGGAARGAPGTRSPGPAAPAAGPVDMYALTATALSLRGTPYRDAGSDPHGFDCSGFTQYVFAHYGVVLPREVHQQYRLGHAVRREDLRAGDLLFFTTIAPGASHVGIAIGGDQFIHAPSSKGVVRVERLSEPYWSRRFIGAKRVE